jgi:hypothetical protein
MSGRVEQTIVRNLIASAPIELKADQLDFSSLRQVIQPSITTRFDMTRMDRPSHL